MVLPTHRTIQAPEQPIALTRSGCWIFMPTSIILPWKSERPSMAPRKDYEKAPFRARASGRAEEAPAALSTSLAPPRQRVGGGEDEDHSARHQGAVLLGEAAHCD